MIRRLRPDDAEPCLALRREALLDAPLAFASSLEDAAAPTLASVTNLLEYGPTSVVLGYFEDRLVGMAGVFRDHHVKAGFKAHLWGMYIASTARRQGAGRTLLDAALAYAASIPGVERVELGVSDAAPGARALYEAAGFTAWGYEPDALRFGSESTGLHLMKRELRTKPRNAR